MVVTAIVSFAGLLGTAFTLGYVSAAKKHSVDVANALRLWAMGAAPPIVFAAYVLAFGVLERGTTLSAEDSSLLGLSSVSLFFAPLWFCTSLATARPFRNGVFVEVLRLTIFVGWLAAGGITLGLAAGI